MAVKTERRVAKKGSVLIVDDEEIMREVLETLLSSAGYRVDLAKTGEEGLEFYGRRAYDVVLLDVHMPDGSGIDFLRNLRKQSGTARLPVLVLTAEGEDRILREARRLGAALVTKPFSPTKLSQRIAMMFGDIQPEEDAGGTAE